MKKFLIGLKTIAVFLLVLISNLYLQFMQNNLSFDLAVKFAFSWHTEKFFLGCLVLLMVIGFLIGLSGSVLFGSVTYTIIVGLIGFATYQKMTYRQEPLYPDDLKMLGQLGMLKDLVGWPLFILCLALIVVAVAAFLWSIWRSFKLPKKIQYFRVGLILISTSSLLYVSNFNDENNLLRKAYNKTALWIPYSQKMNYYNTGFMGGFLFNLKVVAMDQPSGYSEAAIKKIVAEFPGTKASEAEEQPNIIYVMSESFSDPAHLKGVSITGDPLKDYYQVANKTFSGKMLSQNYGGGTANIEFEALTSLSMEPFNPQMTTPYTLLVPKMQQLPSLVSFLKGQNYQTTAIHPYDTSMYKRKDVYNVLGFDEFLDQDTMKHTDKIQNNEYISDAAAYHEILDRLTKNQKAQFVHLVTMQTHMPYSGKYSNIPYTVSADGNTSAIANYLQDVAYASEALKAFTEELAKLPRRTIVVFWGDHLPGIYSESIQAANSGSTLHETQFLIYDSQNKLTQKNQHDNLLSPIYFAPNLLEQSGNALSGFYQLVAELQKDLPAFEKNRYYQNGQWQKEVKLTGKEKQLYEAYRMIQYDLVSGGQYSIKEGFYKAAESAK